MKQRLWLAGACAALICASAARGASEPGSMEQEARRIDEGKLIVRERDLQTMTVYQWERDGKLFHAWPDQKQEVPYDASVMDARLYNLPTGQLRKLYFRDGVRSAWHVNDDDIVMYNLAPLHQVEFVGNKVFDGYPRDATIHPAGVRHHSETIEAGWKLEFAFAPQGRSGADLIGEVARGKTEQSLVEEVRGGVRSVRLAAQSDSASPGRFSVVTYTFPGYTLVEAHYPRGEVLPVHSNRNEKLAYVVSGRLRVTIGELNADVGSGDLLRMPRDMPFSREALEDSVVIEIDGSRAPPAR